MIANGSCSRGDSCWYDHSKKAMAAAKEAKGKGGAAVNTVDNWDAKAEGGKKGYKM